MNRLFILISLFFLNTYVSMAAQPYTRLSTRFIARNEQTILEVCFPEGTTLSQPIIPTGNDKFTIDSSGAPSQMMFTPDRKREYVMRFAVSCSEVGQHTIPPVMIPTETGTTIKTEPIVFEVFNPDELQWQEITVAGKPFRYAAVFRAAKKKPYIGENVPCEIKLYVPSNLQVEDWGVPEYQRNGISSWRFEPSPFRLSETVLLGGRYLCMSYPSSLSPSHAGDIILGPGKIRLTTIQVVIDSYARREYQEININVPQLEMQAQALPSGAPEGFENAVGNFQIQSKLDDVNVKSGDPLAITLNVTGTGNLDSLKAPVLMDQQGWKIYPATSEQRGEERRQVSGSVIFHQFLRAQEAKSMIPPYQLSFFNPDTKAYETVRSEPITVQIPVVPSTTPQISPAVATTSSNAIVPKNVPVEQMQDILSLIRNPQAQAASAFQIPMSLIHWIGGIIAFTLSLRLLLPYLTRACKISPERKQRRAQISQLQSISDDSEFLRSAGRFIEKEQLLNEQTKLILSERDQNCFKGEQRALSLPPKRRQEILKTLRQLSLIALCFWLATKPISQAATLEEGVQLYQKSEFQKASEIWFQSAPYEQLSADTLYNIGNAYYRLGSEGHAALFYRRALMRFPQHPEANQNLRFIENKEGSITTRHRSWQQWLTRIPLDGIKKAFFCCMWLSLIATLFVMVRHQVAKSKSLAIINATLATLLAITLLFCWYNYPDDSKYLPHSEQAIIVQAKVKLHADASRTSGTVIEAPRGSVCRLLHSSGRWTYVEMANKTRGWVLSQYLETLIPRGKAILPKVLKPIADEHSA